MAIENEKEQQLQTTDLINKAIEKKMRPVLSKLQSIEAKAAKNSSGGRRAQTSPPNTSGKGKGKTSNTSGAKSSNSSKKKTKGNQQPTKSKPSFNPSTKTKGKVNATTIKNRKHQENAEITADPTMPAKNSRSKNTYRGEEKGTRSDGTCRETNTTTQMETVSNGRFSGRPISTNVEKHPNPPCNSTTKQN